MGDIDQKYYCSNYYVIINKYGGKCGASLIFMQNNDWINSIDSYGWFQWYFIYWLGRRSLGNETQIIGWKGIVSRFKGKFIKIKLLMVDLMIILFYLKLDKFYCIGVMN